MKTFVPREKASKKQRRAMDRKRHVMWEVKPVNKRIESAKVYSHRSRRLPDGNPQGAFL
ncbi:MAG: hypothetical protein GX650_00450 [Clostridiales bacterium]|mgnify:CR=1 FL=1|nr:hypothetical protein [Clostridiales bacterium]